MPRPALVLAAAALALVVGCETTPRAGDRAPPVLSVLETPGTARTRGLPVVFTTDPAREPAETACPDGSRPGGPAQASETPEQRRAALNANYVLPQGQERVALAFLFGDPSGIRSASVSFDARAATLHAPDLPIVERPSHGGGVGRFREWTFVATEPLRTGASLTLDITPTGLLGVPIGVAATDGAGNRMSAVFFVAQASSALCR